jgi:hypothetical protein
MSEKKRSRLSPTQKTDIWRRWKAGQSLHEIGRAYGVECQDMRYTVCQDIRYTLRS